MEYPHQAIYAPLNQVITDSDEESEEEIHNSIKHSKQQIYQQQRVNQNGCIVKKEPPKSLALRQLQNDLNTTHLRRNDTLISATTGKGMQFSKKLFGLSIICAKFILPRKRKHLYACSSQTKVNILHIGSYVGQKNK